jgi:hypothetical protein
LFEIGISLTPLLESELARIDLGPRLRIEVLQLLAGLLALHRDIDETASNQFIDNALSKRTHLTTSALLRSLRRMSVAHFVKTKHRGIEIWEHESLDKLYTASRWIGTWLDELPEKDIDRIFRIYVVPRDAKDEWIGTYMPVLAIVALAWLTDFPPNSRLNVLTNAVHRLTLFHEVGHHVNRHWFGQDPQQESEADEYAGSVARRTLPTWLRFGLALAKFLCPPQSGKA